MTEKYKNEENERKKKFCFLALSWKKASYNKISAWGFIFFNKTSPTVSRYKLGHELMSDKGPEVSLSAEEQSPP